MSDLLNPDLATPGDWIVVPTDKTTFGDRLPTYTVIATGDVEQTVGQISPWERNHSARRMDAALFAASKSMASLLLAALAFKAEQFDGPEDEDISVSGADVVDWFCQWRLEVRQALRMTA